MFVRNAIEDQGLEKLHGEYYQVLFFSPEALLCNASWRDMLQTQVYQENVIALVIDEAHLEKRAVSAFVNI